MKVVKMFAYITDTHLTNIINNDFLKNSFSNYAKIASLRPIYKKERENRNRKLQTS